MDERQVNIAKSLVAAGVTLAFILVLMNFLLLPVYEHQRDKIIEENCPEGLENCTVIIEPSPIWMFLSMSAVIVYIITFRHLEHKRIKNWRSYR